MRVFGFGCFIEQSKFVSFYTVAEDLNAAQETFKNFIKKEFPNKSPIDLQIQDLTEFLEKNGFVYKGKSNE